MKAFKLNITKSDLLGTPRDHQPCSGRAMSVQRRIMDMEKKRLDNVMEVNPSRFINRRHPLFQVENTFPEVCRSR